MALPASCHDQSVGAARSPGEHGRPAPRRVPGLTVCGACAGESLGGPNDGARDEQMRVLRDLAGELGAALTVVDCLDACERGDVVVVRPSAAGRAIGAAPVWLQRMAGPSAMGELREWLAAGGPGVAAEPSGLERHRLVDPDAL